MAADKLVDSTQLDEDLTSVANAIRFKADISGALAFPSGFVTAIGNILPSVDVGPLSVTQNGTYTAPTGTAYSPVTVNVSGGSGGFLYETGEFNPSSDISRPTINFARSHADIPYIISLSDVSSETLLTSNSNVVFNFIYIDGLFGTGFPFSTSQRRVAIANYIYIETASNTITSNVQVRYPFSNSVNNNTLYTRYWVDTTKFMPYTNSTSRYWRTGHTYKWIALWKPTT